MDVRRYIALALVLVAAVTIFAPSRRAVVRVVRPRPAPAVVVPPALTPLEAEHARRSSAGRSPDSAQRTLPSSAPKATKRGFPLVSGPGLHNRPLPRKRRKVPRTKRDRRKPSQRPAQGHEPSNPPAPPPKQCPPVDVRVPAPITVGVGPVGVNCP